MNKNDKLYSLGIRLVKQSLKKAATEKGIEITVETKELLRDYTRNFYLATCQSKMSMTEQIRGELQYISDNFDELYEDVYNQLLKLKSDNNIVNEENKEQYVEAKGRKIIPFSEGQERRIARDGGPIKIIPIRNGSAVKKCPHNSSKKTNGRQGNYDDGR